MLGRHVLGEAVEAARFVVYVSSGVCSVCR